MSNDNVILIQGIYEGFASGDIPAVLKRLSPDVVWNEAENFPYADKNPYVGHDAIVKGVFARLGGEWNGFAVVVEDILDAGDTIVALGRYHGAHKQTGKEIRAQFAHVWNVADGKAVRFQQYTDTLQVARAIGGA